MPCIEETIHHHDNTHLIGANGIVEDNSAEVPHHSDSDCQHCFCSCPCHIPALQPVVQEFQYDYSIAVRFLPHSEPPSDGVNENPDHIPLT